MKSPVYFIKVQNSDSVSAVQEKLRKLIRTSRIFSQIAPRNQAVLKMHFGEQGNKGHVKPEWVKIIAEEIKKKDAVPVMADTNTLYRGRRTNSQDHLSLAAEHGFTFEKTGAEIRIPENIPENERAVAINQKFIQVAKVVPLFLDADVLVDISHFKGHLMTGFGGALKNIGMGCASRQGKLAQHCDVSPYVEEGACVGCGECVEVCPADAIKISDQKSLIDGELCIGCASCIAACPYGAIDVVWESGGTTIQEKMVEYANAVLAGRSGPSVFINFAVKITKECDCLAKDDPRISPDVGLFASPDPVSIDKACYDAVVRVCGRDIFREAHPQRDGMKQLNYAAQLGVGNLEYDLISIDG